MQDCIVIDVVALEVEKDGVVFFWRFQVLEGKSRGGKMVKLSVLIIFFALVYW